MSHSIITLLSDLGTSDVPVAVAKAILMQYAPGATVVDISHLVAHYDLQQAAYLLLSAYAHFPKGTVHVVPVDIFAGATPRMLLAEKDGWFFIVPDNGLLPLAFDGEMKDTRLCFEFSKPYTFADWMNKAGSVIEALQAGSAAQLFSPCVVRQAPQMQQPIVTPDGVECNILYTDRYENVVLNITRQQFDELVKDRPFRIRLRKVQDITAISNNYNDVPVSEALCRFNDCGFMVIALNHGAAASLLGLAAGNTGKLRYQTISIFF